MMEKCKTFKFRQLNQDIGHEILGKHIFANTQINNVWEFVFFYDLLNEHVLHTNLEIDFRKKFNNMRKVCMQKYLVNESEAGIQIIMWLKAKDYEKLNAHWFN